jgi:hypothetical protein
LIYLFSILGNGAPVCAESEDLFGFEQVPNPFQYEQADLDFIAGFFSSGFNLDGLEEPARSFFELSVNAFGAFVHAWMSELPIETEIAGFGRRVIKAADACRGGMEEKRRAAETAACDRGEADTLAVLNAAFKVQHEIDRMTGLLRFSPNSHGVYIARFAPDFLVLPALGEYFTARFGETAWQIIDEKRSLCLRRRAGERPILFKKEKSLRESAGKGDEWEDLWRLYHKTINNESRNNPALQRQFMPKRHWKYLPEM